mgnify:CR=1 FL=1
MLGSIALFAHVAVGPFAATAAAAALAKKDAAAVVAAKAAAQVVNNKHGKVWEGIYN